MQEKGCTIYRNVLDCIVMINEKTKEIKMETKKYLSCKETAKLIRKGLKGARDEKGKFIPRKSLRYLIARGVYNNGIKPSYFFTKPFQTAFKYIPNDLRDAFIFDIEQDKMFFPENMNKN